MTCEHHFEPRYDELECREMPDPETMKRTERLYVHDICIRCGTVVRRESKPQFSVDSR